MACYHPISIGVPKDFLGTGRKTWVEQTVGCGHCLGCRADQARDWSIRLMHEAQMHDAAWFLTLTYQNERIPQHGSLDFTHLRAFFKALRREQPISYYACGEYGEKTQRPHYHAVLYGAPLLDRYMHRADPISPTWRSPTVERHWPHGLSEFSTVTHRSAAYVAGYVRKKISQRYDPDHYTRVDPDTGELIEIQPERSRMSLRPAIAKRWIQKWWHDVYPRDYVVISGRQFRPPRYYDKWMTQNHSDQKDNTCTDCTVHQNIMMDVRMKRDADAVALADEKLAAKEKIHQSRVELYEQRGKI